MFCLRDASGADFGVGGDAGAMPFGEHLHRAANSSVKPSGAAAGGVDVGVVWRCGKISRRPDELASVSLKSSALRLRVQPFARLSAMDAQRHDLK